jgi:PAS domain S-box-containing protein
MHQNARRGATVSDTDRYPTRNAAASLSEQEATYRALFDSIGDAIFLTRDGVFVDCNDAALRMFSATREQMIGQTPVRFSPALQPDGWLSQEKAAAKIAAALAGERQTFEWRHRRLDGSEFDAEVVLSRVEGSAEPLFFGVVRDITARKQAEKALQASHDKFAGAFNSSTDAMIVMRIGETIGEGTFLDANAAASELFGLKRGQIIGKTANETDLLADPSRLLALREEVLTHGGIHAFHATTRHSSGSTREVEISASQFGPSDDRLAILVIRDITEARKAEHRIRELNASLEKSVGQIRAVADNLPVAISYHDAERRFLFINRTMERWFNITAGQAIGKTVDGLVSQEYLQALTPIRERFEKGEYRYEATLPYPDGVRRTVDVAFIPERDADGKLLGFYTLAVDISERKQAEEQVQQSQKMQAIGKLTGGVAHDFNNLLAVICGNLDLAAERNRDDGIAKLLEPARRAAERGSTLTKSLLAFARQQPLSPQVSDLNLLARDMTELLRRTLPSNIAIEFVGGAGLWTCEVDPGQLQNALLNLVVNARDAMPDGGRVTIATRNAGIDAEYAAAHELSAGQYVMLAVSDTGTGMPPEVIARAFEPFYTTKNVGEGTGLGLSMVYGFARQSGGHVSIDSKIGSGTTVKIYLPRWVSTNTEAPEPADRVAPAANHETVLVVEDDADMRLVAVTMLRSLGYAVFEAPDGRAALRALAEHPQVALLVTDVVLAGAMNGRRLAEEARKQSPQLKVLFMSGYTEDAIVHQGRLEPGVHFIQKPFRKQDLAVKAREALDVKRR